MTVRPVTLFPVFIASPSDVRSERKFIAAAVERLSATLTRTRRVALQVVRWEDFAPITDETDHPQHRINRQIRRDSIFIGVRYKRYGEHIKSMKNVSGTEAEFNTALKNRKQIKILTYFRHVDSKPRRAPEQEQYVRLLKLRARLKKDNVFYHEYGSPDQLKQRVTVDIIEALDQLLQPESEWRRQTLANFFLLGRSHKRRRDSPSVQIVYPPIGGPSKSTGSSYKVDIRNSLLPHTVYEDFKAVQKIEGIFRAMGVTDVSSVTSTYPGLRSEPGNRIWLCLPRNRPGLEVLNRLGERVRFQFRDGRTERTVIWSGGKEKVRIKSPLSRYLTLQRPASGDWDPAYADVIAKDFAVIARFRVSGEDRSPQNDYYHYFLAGIRGLGTWGAAWYLDRHGTLVDVPIDDKGSAQTVVEVTYRNHRIVDVVDVSKEDQKFFSKRNGQLYIRSQVKLFNESRSR